MGDYDAIGEAAGAACKAVLFLIPYAFIVTVLLLAIIGYNIYSFLAHHLLIDLSNNMLRVWWI